MNKLLQLKIRLLRETTKQNMLLVSQFHFVYWYNIVLMVLTRSASSVDDESMFLTGQILNGKQSSLNAQSADKLSFIHDYFFLLSK